MSDLDSLLLDPLCDCQLSSVSQTYPRSADRQMMSVLVYFQLAEQPDMTVDESSLQQR